MGNRELENATLGAKYTSPTQEPDFYFQMIARKPDFYFSHDNKAIVRVTATPSGPGAGSAGTAVCVAVPLHESVLTRTTRANLNCKLSGTFNCVRWDVASAGWADRPAGCAPATRNLRRKGTAGQCLRAAAGPGEPSLRAGGSGARASMPPNGCNLCCACDRNRLLRLA